MPPFGIMPFAGSGNRRRTYGAPTSFDQPNAPYVGRAYGNNLPGPYGSEDPAAPRFNYPVPSFQQSQTDIQNRRNNFSEDLRQQRALTNAQRNGAISPPQAPTYLLSGGRAPTVIPGTMNLAGTGTAPGTPTAGGAKPAAENMPFYSGATPPPVGIAAPPQQRYDPKAWKAKLGSLKAIRDAYPKDSQEYEQAHQSYVAALQENHQQLEASQAPAAPQSQPYAAQGMAPPTGVAAPAHRFDNSGTPTTHHPLIGQDGRVYGYADQAPEMTPNTSAPPTVTPGLRIPISMLGPDSSGGSAGAPLSPMAPQLRPGPSIQAPATITPGAQSYGTQLMPRSYTPANQVADVSVGAPPSMQAPTGSADVSFGGPPPITPPAAAQPTQAPQQQAAAPQQAARAKQWTTYVGSLKNQIDAEESTTEAKYIPANEQTGSPGHWLKTSPKLDELKRQHADALRQWAEEKQGVRKRGETGPLGQQPAQAAQPAATPQTAAPQANAGNGNISQEAYAKLKPGDTFVWDGVQHTKR